ncbi:MAG: TlpA disulfide reductase family protein [Ignavibacteriota bacterium]
MKIKLLFTFIFLLIQSEFPQSISGELTSCTGAHLIRADIQIISNTPSFPKPIIKVLKVNEDGKFYIPSEFIGFYKIRFCGIDHKPLEVPFFINNNENITVKIKLEANRIDDSSELKIIGDFNNYSKGKSAILMEKNGDGKYVATITATADTLAFQILESSNKNNPINKTQADYFYLEDDGNYISVLKTKKDAQYQIIVNRNDFKDTICNKSVYFENENTTKFVYELIKDIDERKLKQNLRFDEFIKNGGDRNSFKPDYTEDIKALKVLAENTTKEKAAYYYFAIAKLSGITDSVNCENILAAFSETSPIWSIAPNLIRTITSNKTKQEQLLYFENIYNNHKDESIKPFLLLEILNNAKELNDVEKTKKYYEMFVDKYPNNEFYLIVKNEYSPNRNMQVGKIVPEFEFTSIDDSTLTLFNENIKGKVYLIDFWATWCVPCVEEMKGLHDAYDKYKKNGLNIISVSMDFNIDEVYKFRKEKWPLPWFNSFLKYDPNNKIVKDFELIIIPKPVLINQTGKIIASGMDLRGSKLDETLNKLFNP